MSADDVIITGDYRDHADHDVGVFDLLLSDIPYAVGADAYGSNPMWYERGDNRNGMSSKAGRAFFATDNSFDLDAYAQACSLLLKPEPKEVRPGCVITFCSFQQQSDLIQAMAENGFRHYIPLSFVKKNSAQALKANQRYCGATEHAIVSYRDRLPLWRNHGQMILDWLPFRWEPNALHPTQKPQTLMEELIRLHTEPGMRVCDLTCGSGTTCAAAKHLGRHYAGFETDPQYAAIARRRCERQAVTGDLFEDMEATA